MNSLKEYKGYVILEGRNSESGLYVVAAHRESGELFAAFECKEEKGMIAGEKFLISLIDDENGELVLIEEETTNERYSYTEDELVSKMINRL